MHFNLLTRIYHLNIILFKRYVVALFIILLIALVIALVIASVIALSLRWSSHYSPRANKKMKHTLFTYKNVS